MAIAMMISTSVNPATRRLESRPRESRSFTVMASPPLFQAAFPGFTLLHAIQPRRTGQRRYRSGGLRFIAS